MAGLMVSGTQVSYIGQDCREIPEHLGRDCGHFAKRLDLSFNLLRDLRRVDSHPIGLTLNDSSGRPLCATEEAVSIGIVLLT
uniref:Uncharacterized protein n=1 Tax=Myotis myotis TaxID=51298 RepID=A0A7J7TTW6_MYOMY|nr:hypothetical protein mMyoMyo1_012441 [Myotis myotis]